MATSTEQALEFIQDELDTAALYDTLASCEADRRLADVYHRLAAAERRHADHWTTALRERGVALKPFRPSWRARALMWLAKRFGPGMVISVIDGQEQADARKYSGVADRAAGMSADEVGHARALRAIAGSSGAEGPFIARLEGRHRTTAG